ncbi:hypothetical protein TNCV_2476811 [Trichonephila clavipes]|nr:hypothetical protein TNCV_2476811 [Trichonephila clavipes]
MFFNLTWSHCNLVIKVTDSWLACHEGGLKTRHVEWATAGGGGPFKNWSVTLNWLVMSLSVVPLKILRAEEIDTLKICRGSNILPSVNDEAHFWLNGYVNKQNCRIWSEANPQVYVETPLHPEKLTVWCALWAGGILLQKR